MLHGEREPVSTAQVGIELISTARLADVAARDTDFMQVAELYRGREDFDVARLVENESVPCLPVLRYKLAGMDKRRAWEQTWELQRLEDAIDTRKKLPEDVVTPQLVRCFEDALSFIRSGLETNTSKACYLHGSFGSGKGHFMAVLHLILNREPAARSIPELAPAIDRSNAWTEGRKFLQGLLSVLRDSGHAGLLIVLDEVETIQRVRSDVRDKSLNALRQLIDEVDSGRFPGLYLLITGTPAFFEGPQGVQRLEPLAQRLHVDFQTEARFDNPRAVQIGLPAFDLNRLTVVGTKIRDIFHSPAAAPRRVAERADDTYITDRGPGTCLQDCGARAATTGFVSNRREP